MFNKRRRAKQKNIKTGICKIVNYSGNQYLEIVHLENWCLDIRFGKLLFVKLPFEISTLGGYCKYEYWII